jgi:hemolysin III
MQVLPPLVISLIVAGGVLYTAGVIFHIWDRLKFHNAIWHGFVAVAAACHFAAITLLYW